MCISIGIRTFININTANETDNIVQIIYTKDWYNYYNISDYKRWLTLIMQKIMHDVCVCVCVFMWVWTWSAVQNSIYPGVRFMAQQLTNLARIHKDAGLIQASLSGLRIRCFCELWCRSQTWLRSCVAVAVV